LMRQAARIAINRIAAGVHFPVDAVAGQVLGLKLGEYFVHRCAWDPTAPGNTFNFVPFRFVGTAFPGANDFNFRDLYDTGTGNFLAPVYIDQLALVTGKASPLLGWLWRKAQAEWT
jgi:hypothetical protein